MKNQHNPEFRGNVVHDISSECTFWSSVLQWLTTCCEWAWRHSGGVSGTGGCQSTATRPFELLLHPQSFGSPVQDECRSLQHKNANQTRFPSAQHMHPFTQSALLQFCSSALLGQSGTPSHSGLTLLIQEVALHWKFPLQFNTGRQDGDDEAWLTVQFPIH